MKAILIVLFACLLAVSADAQKRPNVVLIIADDLGYGDLSSWGAKDVKSPAVDSLVARGVRLNRFYANCPVCSPSRASLLSGRYPELAGVPGVIRTSPTDNWGYLAPDAMLLPVVLKKAGYHTAIVGKWHLGLEAENAPLARGFDHFHGFLGDMMDSYTTHRRHDINYMRENDKEIDPTGHATDLFTQWAVDYIQQRAPDARAGKQPFFLYLAYNAPHTPIQPPQEWLDKVKAREPGITPKRAALVALIEHMDDGIGKVLAALKQSGVEEDTLVLFTSDNGGDLPPGANNGPLRAGKGTMYEGGLRVAMTAAWPGRILAGSSSDQVALHMDLMPTICEAAGAQPPARIDGRSILAALCGKPADLPPRDLFFIRREGGPFFGLTIHAVLRGDMKLVHNSPFGPLELYNLKDDPREERDLAEKMPKVRTDLARAMQHQVIRSGGIPWNKPTPPAR